MRIVMRLPTLTVNSSLLRGASCKGTAGARLFDERTVKTNSGWKFDVSHHSTSSFLFSLEGDTSEDVSFASAIVDSKQSRTTTVGALDVGDGECTSDMGESSLLAKK